METEIIKTKVSKNTSLGKLFFMQCEYQGRQDFYFIEITQDDNVGSSFRDHQNSQVDDVVWTRQRKPIGISSTVNINNYYLADMWVKRYMAKYGINNVRGGINYRKNVIDLDAAELVRKEICENYCFRCGQPNHLMDECSNEQNVGINRPCLRCGRNNHTINDCSAITTIEGIKPKDNLCYRCGRENHWKIFCTEQKDINGNKLRPNLTTMTLGWFW